MIDVHVQAGRHVEDAAGIVTANGQLVRPRTVDRDAARDQQFAGAQRDGAMQSGREVDLIGALAKG